MKVTKFDLQNNLKKYFGFNKFKGLQEKAMENIIDGNDTFVIMPTGGGKSLIYQLPALIMPHLTLVVSPLLALMKDQIDFLTSHNIPAASINSTQSREESNEVLQGIRNGQIKILMISVERLKNERFREFIKQIPINTIGYEDSKQIIRSSGSVGANYIEANESLSKKDLVRHSYQEPVTPVLFEFSNLYFRNYLEFGISYLVLAR